jgi:beta-glucanase (GH16 family)
MTTSYRAAGFIAGGPMGRATVFLCLVYMLLPQLALAQAPKSSASPEPPEPIRGKGYKLVQNWDFGVNIRDEAQLRQQFHTRYIYSNGNLDHLKDEWQRYRDNANHVFVDGNLALVARVPGALRTGEVESGMLRSKWAGQYGYFEIRMKVPAGRGLWPAFWLNPEDKRWPPEIDVVEIVNNGRDTTLASFHFLHGIGKKTSRVTLTQLDRWGAYRPGFDYANGFHDFAVEWTEEAVRHYVDGVLVADRTFEWKHDDGTDGGPAHVLVNLAVGGKWPGPPVQPDVFPAKLEIDYIRVWQR